MILHYQLLYFALFVFSLVLGEDYYQLLNIEKNADNREIRKAFKKLALKLHPDKNPDDPNSNEKFLRINRAYEVLKDEKTRNVYDMHGEAGLKNDNRHSGNRYQDWNYYNDNFGIYDNDDEIITLSTADFDQSVGKNGDGYIWFINFYSTRCSHCHILAPEWRKLAKKLHTIIRIGAVNCEDDRPLCQRENIRSYPSLILYPQGLKFQGKRQVDSLIEFVMEHIQINKRQFSERQKFQETIDRLDGTIMWSLMVVCNQDIDCLPPDTLKLLTYKLKHLANVLEVICNEQSNSICKYWNFDHSQLVLFPDIQNQPNVYYPIKLQSKSESAGDIFKMIIVKFKKASKLPNKALKYLGRCLIEQEMTDECEEIIPIDSIIVFLHMKTDTETLDNELSSLISLKPEVQVFKVHCDEDNSLCSQMFIAKFPSVIMVKKHAQSYEHYHGRVNSIDMAQFASNSFKSSITTLNPKLFEQVVVNDPEPWLIEFHSPWCPMCKTMLQVIRKASNHFDGQDGRRLLSIGTIDCTVHSNMCRQYNIRAYPTVILYNQTTPHQFSAATEPNTLIDFINDVFNFKVIQLDPISFTSLVEKRPNNEIWVVDFFSPYCKPCVQLAPTWYKLAGLIHKEENKNIKIANFNCARWNAHCRTLNVNSYPTLRLYPALNDQNHRQTHYSCQLPDKNNVYMLRSWIYEYYPSNVKDLDDDNEFELILTSDNPHLINFYAPWAFQSRKFSADFIRMSRNLTKIQFVRLNCERFHWLCQNAYIDNFPSLRFYEGTGEGRRQSYEGRRVPVENVDRIENTLLSLLNQDNFKIKKDEL